MVTQPDSSLTQTQGREPDHGTGKGGLGIFVVVIACIVVAVFIIGVLPRLQQKDELKQAHQETVDAVPVVHVISAKPAALQESITLPCNIGAMQYTTIYARVDGYLKSRFVDIGDQVKTGQLLAEIETPTIDQHLAQASADLNEAKAKLLSEQAQLKEAIAKQSTANAEVQKVKADVTYTSITADRWQNLCERGAVSQQSRDEKVRSFEATNAQLMAAQANEKAAIAQVAAAKAAVQVAKAAVEAKLADYLRVKAEQSFKNVTAPFDGIITLRKVDPGALITQGSQSNNLELFQMAKIDNLRIYVAVPQRVARYLRPGMEAQILVPEYPERNFIGEVTNISGGLDPNTRTRQTEIKIKNKDHSLLPGMYAQVRLTTLREAPWIRVPGTTLVVRPDGQFVVVVKDGKAHYQPITIGRDYGDEVEIRKGLQGKEQVVVSPSDDLLEGEEVQAMDEPPPSSS